MADARDPVLQDDYAQRIKDSDELHNINCYEYLLNLFNTLPEHSASRFETLKNFYSTFNEHKIYDQNYPYGNLYVSLLFELENEMQLAIIILGNNPTNTNKIDKANEMFEDASNLILALYENPNRSLERTSSMLKSVTDKIQHTLPASNKAINEKLKSSSGTDINESNPYRTGSFFGVTLAYSSALLGNYRPQKTSLPAIRTYAYKAVGAYPTELRFGTQGQYYEGVARVSPLFYAWLLVKQEKTLANLSSLSTTTAAAAAAPASSSSNSFIASSASLPCLHVYINNMRLDSAGELDKIKDIEIPLSRKLHELEQLPGLKIAVITLPADNGLMSKKMLQAHERKYRYQDAFSRMLCIATGNSQEKIQDFFISNKIKEILYGVNESNGYNKDRESENIKALLTNSFIKLGFNVDSILSPAQFHAVYFHFIKFELTNFILYSLTPHTFNMTCKDAIDRGGVSSAYYNLITSIESGNPMTQEEFMRALHAAPAMVKGRAMNHHIVALWNAIDSYIDAHPAIAVNQALTWLVEWRDNNVPENSKRSLQNEIHRYIVQRSGESDNAESLTSISGFVKLQAANHIEALSRGVKYTEFTFQVNEWKALQQGRLGKIVAKMVEHGLINLTPYAPKQPGIELYPGYRS